jgi:hypothetical protein
VQRRNRYCGRSRIPGYKSRPLIRYLALDLSASDAAGLTGLTHQSVSAAFLEIGRRPAEDCERRSPFSGGEVEADGGYSGARGARQARPRRIRQNYRLRPLEARR